MSTAVAVLDARATVAYTAYVIHLHGCHPCQDADADASEGVDCPTGTRLREAWKTARNASLRARREAPHPAAT
ncbi:hypothetical protein SMD44_04603 [Streptomyces alboflavus]|uniref:Uncharacterized protein n=1 Tax=Streptomyces alboflavus TaxID=67267 RepID=A0A1Z1WFC6_9ACTN|nr:hypothetical protein [Streptomyces alboflavus]ARX85144.1 hypothetical protein SMD44_04603 [Streptomyces alboflavus]